MDLKKGLFVLYLFAVVIGFLLVIEYICLRLNSASGVRIPFAVSAPSEIPRRHKRTDIYNVLDPHLGYAHGDTEANVQAIVKRYAWVNGFVVYSDRPTDLKRPIILVLGGSTTDGVMYGHSWPEELAKLLVNRGTAGTVINGGTGGYSTNQELLKLIRDGLEFLPDVIISYSGVNDYGRYSKLPHPMVHSYQRQIFEHLTRSAHSPLLPNTIAWLRRVLFTGSESSKSYTLGVKSSLTLGQQYERNVVLMESIARAQGATFFGIIQPNAYFRSKHLAKFKKKGADTGLRALYGQIIELPTRLAFIYDLTRIFDDHEGVYKEDGIHLTQEGDQIIAEKIMALISAELAKRTSEPNP